MDHKQEVIQVLLCEPHKKAHITTIANTLQSLQQTVGGCIEALYPYSDSVAVICNDKGKINGLELNRTLRDEDGRVYDIVAGTFLVVGLADEHFTSLTPELQKKYTQLFEYPEMFIRVGSMILAMPEEG